jgi:hypothetical protein
VTFILFFEIKLVFENPIKLYFYFLPDCNDKFDGVRTFFLIIIGGFESILFVSDFSDIF